MGSEEFFSRPNDPGIDPLVSPGTPDAWGRMRRHRGVAQGRLGAPRPCPAHPRPAVQRPRDPIGVPEGRPGSLPRSRKACRGSGTRERQPRCYFMMKYEIIQQDSESRKIPMVSVKSLVATHQISDPVPGPWCPRGRRPAGAPGRPHTPGGGRPRSGREEGGRRSVRRGVSDVRMVSCDVRGDGEAICDGHWAREKQ